MRMKNPGDRGEQLHCYRTLPLIGGLQWARRWTERSVRNLIHPSEQRFVVKAMWSPTSSPTFPHPKDRSLLTAAALLGGHITSYIQEANR